MFITNPLWPDRTWFDSLWEAAGGRRPTVPGNPAAGRAPIELPALNVWIGSHGATITSELPGVDPASLDVVVVGDTVTIRAKRQIAAPQAEARCLRRERGDHDYARSIQLPFPVDPASAKADYRQGVLRLTLTRPAEQLARRIVVNAN